MALDPITETIAHFVGFFDQAVEEARGRIEYNEFRALKAQVEEEAKLAAVGRDMKAPYTLTDADPYLHYVPFQHPVVELTAGSHVGASYFGPASVHPHWLAPQPFANLSLHTASVSHKLELDVPLPGSVAVIVEQQNFLRDNDFVSMTDASVPMTAVSEFDDDLDALMQKGNLLDTIPDLVKPGSEGSIAALVDDLAKIIRDTTADGPEDASIFVAKGESTAGKHVNGLAVDDAPKLSDYLPTEETEDDTEAAPSSFAHGAHAEGAGSLETSGHVTLEAGANLMINEAYVYSHWISAPVIAVQGDAVDVDIISQINIWSDADSIEDQFQSWMAEDAGTTAAFNIAAITSDSAMARRPPPAGVHRTFRSSGP